MSRPPALTLPPAPAAPPDAGGTAGDDFVRLAGCPRCGGTRRALVEVHGELRGRCLACGDHLDLPLATERHGRTAGDAVVQLRGTASR